MSTPPHKTITCTPQEFDKEFAEWYSTLPEVICEEIWYDVTIISIQHHYRHHYILYTTEVTHKECEE